MVNRFCSVAFDIRHALRNGQLEEAKAIAIKHLRAGYHSKEFLNAIAELLEHKKQKGRPKISLENRLEIGLEFVQLESAGRRYGARKALAKKYHCSVSEISTIVDWFKKAKDNNDPDIPVWARDISK